MVFAITIVCIFLTLVIVRISHLFYTWANPKCNGKLPPGSTGFPLIGETLEFFKPHGLYEIPPFIKSRMESYGSLFRTNLFGQNVIVSTDHEINYQIFQQENKSFVMHYTESFVQIFGRKSISVQRGTMHKYLRNLILNNLTNPTNLKDIIHEMDEVIRRHLDTWANHGTIEVKEASADIIFEFFEKKLMSYEESNLPGKRLRDCFKSFMDGLISVPLYIPGTAFHTSIQGRKNAVKVIKSEIEKRKTTKIPRNHDFLDHLLEEAKKEDSFLEKEMAVDLIFALLFAAYETTSSAMTLAIKFLSENPQALAELTKEHELILENRETKDAAVTWKEYKSMTFTHMVINETVRLANIAPGIFRKAIADVEINGYTIPKDWFVMVVPAVVHLDGNKYENPLEFNPWRWKDKELNVGSKTFMAFGGGVRLCVGAESAKVQISIILHYLVTKYRWSFFKGGSIVRVPGLTFPNGLHIQLSKKSD